MPTIQVLDKYVVDQIAAGEVVERPSSVVKELVENAIDAGATAITVEVKNGGIDLIRVTDNGCGIEREQVATAFLSHATSKIRTSEDLSQIDTLGFRGEALSSIAAVTRLEIVTKRAEDLTGTNYTIAGGDGGSLTEIGAPNGTTFLVRDIFYNTPARRKFLKTAMTEGSYIADLLERFALSHPDISFRFLNGGSVKLQTTGNGKLKDLIYTIYGRDTANEIMEFSEERSGIQITGAIGKPVLAKGNRSYENYFINGRYVKSQLITRAIEDAYGPFMMQHRYPFTVLYISLPSDEFDVNVHPTKMELRFQKEPVVYDAVYQILRKVLSHKEFAPDVKLTEEKKEDRTVYRAPEPFETKRLQDSAVETCEKRAKVSETTVQKDTEIPSGLRKGSLRDAFTAEVSRPEPVKVPVPEKTPECGQIADAITKPDDLLPTTSDFSAPPVMTAPAPAEPAPAQRESAAVPSGSEVQESKPEAEQKCTPEQATLFDTGLISEEGIRKHKLIGQVFDTYWIVQLDDKMYILDQHAAHEKVLYERKLAELREKKHSSQMISPPVMVTLSPRAELMLNRYMDEFSALGYEISSFGGKEYAISAVPYDLYTLDTRQVFMEMLSDLEEEFSDKKGDMVLAKLASMSCKAAVKGGNQISREEADALISELLSLENPYACPHGRPTLITLTRRELEKKFKRII